MTEQPPSTGEQPDCGTLVAENCRQLATRVQHRVDAMLERDGSEAAAITGKGIALGFMLTRDILSALTHAADELDELRRAPVPPTDAGGLSSASNTDPSQATTAAPSRHLTPGEQSVMKRALVRSTKPVSPPAAVVDYTSVTAAGIVGDWQDKWSIDQEQFNAALDDLELEVRRALSAVASEAVIGVVHRGWAKAVAAAKEEERAAVASERDAEIAALYEAAANHEKQAKEAEAALLARLREPDVREASLKAVMEKKRGGRPPSSIELVDAAINAIDAVLGGEAK